MLDRVCLTLHHVLSLGSQPISVQWSEADLPCPAYVEREGPSGGIFASTHFLACPAGHVINVHDNIMYAYINMVDGASANDGSHAEIDPSNVLKVTEDQLNEDQKQKMAQAIDEAYL